MLKEAIVIVNQLNQEPFLKNLTFPLFEALAPAKLMEIFNEVLTEIQPKHAENIQDKTDEDRVQQIIGLLTILEYGPIKGHCNLQAIREGLEHKDKMMMCPILFWLLQDVPARKRKAYLSQFTLDINVPLYLAHDKTICMYMERHKEQLQAFHKIFAQYEDMQARSVARNNLIVENKTLTRQKSSMLKLKERLHVKLESMTDSPNELLKVARQLRLEMEREKELARQSAEQEEQLSRGQKILYKLEHQSRGQVVADADPMAIMEELQKNFEANTVKVNETLPVELEDMRKNVAMLQNLAEMPSVTAAHLLETKKQIKDVTTEMNRHNVETALNQTCREEKLNSMREEASIINETKKSKAKELQDLKDRLGSAEKELRMSPDVNDMERNLLAELRSRKDDLREKYGEVIGLKATHADLQETAKNLKKRAQYLKPLLNILEDEQAQASLGDTQKTLERMLAVKEEVNSQNDKSETRKLMTMMVHLRTNLSQVTEEYKAVRQQCHELLDRYETESMQGKPALKQRVTSLRGKVAELEKKFNEQLAQNEVNQKKLKAAILELEACDNEAKKQTTKSVKSKGPKVADCRRNTNNTQQRMKERDNELSE